MIAETVSRQGWSPFIARFATALDAQMVEILRYDVDRQVSQVLIEGVWVDAVNAPACMGGTRMTKVTHETTDDA